jgi:CDP-glycerol glycerophosphotransferase
MSSAKSAAPSAPDPLADELAYHEFAELSHKTVKRPLVLFFGRPTFADNAKYLYLATLRAATGCEVVWCGYSRSLLAELHQHGLPCFDLAQDFRTTCTLLLEAAVAVFCESPKTALADTGAFSGCLAGAQKLQLWHGVSVKHLCLMLVPHLDVGDALFRRQTRFATRIDHMVSTGSALDAFWVRAFGCPSLVRAGQPRNEVIVRPPTQHEMIGAELPRDQAELLRRDPRRKFLVVPTWQRGKVQIHISTPAFHQQLARWAAATDSVVFVKSHPYFQRDAVPPALGGRVFFLGAGVDVYPWLSKFDALITDYSSIMFDFLLLHRPIFTYDTRRQVARDFEPDYSLIPEGDFRYDFDADSFEAVVAKNFANHSLRDSQRALSAQLFETAPADACAQLIPFITSCVTNAVDKNFTLTTPTVPASLALAAI